jgi:hypothetical protein
LLGPEINASEAQSEVLRTEVRKNAAPREEFRIALSAADLEAAGIELVTTESEATEARASAILAGHTRELRLQQATDLVRESSYQDVEARRTLFRTQIRDQLRSELSGVSEVERASDRFVPNDGEIDTRQRTVLTADIGELVARDQDPNTGDELGRVRLRGRIALTPGETQTLLDGATQPTSLTEAEVEQKLGVPLDKPPAVYRLHLEPDPCRPVIDGERCLGSMNGEHEEGGDEEGEDEEGGDEEGEDDEGEGEGEENGTNGTASNGNHAGNGVAFEKDVAIAELFARQAAPESPVEFGLPEEEVDLENTTTAGGISEAIEQVVFSPGPADVPAFYDFHDLQLAFEPVWQEALDDVYLDDVEDAYDQIVERGGAPALVRVNNLVTNPAGRMIDGLQEVLSDVVATVYSDVPPVVAAAVLISLEEWRALPGPSQSYLYDIATAIKDLREKIRLALEPTEVAPLLEAFGIEEVVRAANNEKTVAYRAQLEIWSADAERLVAHARRRLLEREVRETFRPTHAIIEKLRGARGSSYPFRYFAASDVHRSVNFGLLVTYRQKWTPVSYQVGELVSTIPLAPKEIRRFSKRTVIKTRRARQEIESNLVSRRGESEERTRSEAEIVARATAKTNFSLSNEGSFSIGNEALGGSATTTSTFTREADRHSQSVKKEFREAILKSAEEYKNERKVEVTTEETYESEITESGEIQNPNDEIPVTFLFYELQRRFRVSERLHRLQSIVFVAQEMPLPSEVDAAWLIRYDWILNRVLLDDSFRPALTYASTTLVSEDVVLREMRQAIFRQRQLVEELKEDVADRRALAGLRYAALQRQIERTAESASDDGGGGLFGGLGDIVGGIPIVGGIVESGIDLLTGGGDEGASQEAQIREGAARDAFERERREEQELASRLLNALSTLEAMQREYSERLGNHLRELAQVERLITHIVQNVMHYMQAIWSYEPDDQRFLRLRNVPVPVFEKDKNVRRWIIDPAAQGIADQPMVVARTFGVSFDFGISLPPQQPQEIETKPLSEVAEIDRPLGFLGNYMIFPLIEANPITEFMMDPYVTSAEGEYGVSDPDLLGNMTLDEFSDYVCCLKRHFESEDDGENGGGDDVENGNGNGNGNGNQNATFEDLKPYLRDTLKRLLQLSLRNDDEIIVPSNSLYIEALPGAHSVMEKFKHLHRQIDVKTAQENLRRVATDNVRRAQRILDDELEDPDIEAKYVFEGDGAATVVPPPGPNP